MIAKIFLVLLYLLSREIHLKSIISSMLRLLQTFAVCFGGNNIALCVLMEIYKHVYHWRDYITGYTSVLKYVWFNWKKKELHARLSWTNTRSKKLKRRASFEFCIHLDMSQIGIVCFTKWCLGILKISFSIVLKPFSQISLAWISQKEVKSR